MNKGHALDAKDFAKSFLLRVLIKASCTDYIILAPMYTDNWEDKDVLEYRKRLSIPDECLIKPVVKYEWRKRGEYFKNLMSSNVDVFFDPDNGIIIDYSEEDKRRGSKYKFYPITITSKMFDINHNRMIAIYTEHTKPKWDPIIDRLKKDGFHLFHVWFGHIVRILFIFQSKLRCDKVKKILCNEINFDRVVSDT